MDYGVELPEMLERAGIDPEFIETSHRPVVFDERRPNFGKRTLKFELVELPKFNPHVMDVQLLLKLLRPIKMRGLVPTIGKEVVALCEDSSFLPDELCLVAPATLLYSNKKVFENQRKKGMMNMQDMPCLTNVGHGPILAAFIDLVVALDALRINSRLRPVRFVFIQK